MSVTVSVGASFRSIGGVGERTRGRDGGIGECLLSVKVVAILGA
jgi:hypothetical protein